MTQKMAERIAVLRAGYTNGRRAMHSWRRLAEMICDEFPEETEINLRGNQLYGKELCLSAEKVLGLAPYELELEDDKICFIWLERQAST